MLAVQCLLKLQTISDAISADASIKMQSAVLHLPLRLDIKLGLPAQHPLAS